MIDALLVSSRTAILHPHAREATMPRRQRIPLRIHFIREAGPLCGRLVTDPALLSRALGAVTCDSCRAVAGPMPATETVDDILKAWRAIR